MSRKSSACLLSQSCYQYKAGGMLDVSWSDDEFSSQWTLLIFGLVWPIGPSFSHHLSKINSQISLDFINPCVKVLWHTQLRIIYVFLKKHFLQISYQIIHLIILCISLAKRKQSEKSGPEGNETNKTVIKINSTVHQIIIFFLFWQTFSILPLFCSVFVVCDKFSFLLLFVLLFKMFFSHSLDISPTITHIFVELHSEVVLLLWFFQSSFQLNKIKRIQCSSQCQL